MSSVSYNILDEEDFTIIYKGKSENSVSESICEIKVSKFDLVKKLRYFRKKINEIQNINEIYIHEKYHTNVFQDFINSIVTKSIQINSSNCHELLELSTKYEYLEMREKAENFIQERPDIESIINEFQTKKADTNDNDSQYIIDPVKEEIISKNLDICIQNNFLDRIPIPILMRILNSPHRILHNHHHLFQFVIKKMNNKCDNENIEILPSCLDFNEMSIEEIEEFIHHENCLKTFKPKNEDEMIKRIINQLKEKNSNFEKQINDLFKNCNDVKQNEELLKQKYEQKISDINIKFEEVNQKAESTKKLCEQQSVIIQKQETIIQSLLGNIEQIKCEIAQIKERRKLDEDERKKRKKKKKTEKEKKKKGEGKKRKKKERLKKRKEEEKKRKKN